jgi:hypothetical protein
MRSSEALHSLSRSVKFFVTLRSTASYIPAISSPLQVLNCSVVRASYNIGCSR